VKREKTGGSNINWRQFVKLDAYKSDGKLFIDGVRVIAGSTAMWIIAQILVKPERAKEIIQASELDWRYIQKLIELAERN